MNSKRSQEGYLLIDHRAGEGLGPAGTPLAAGAVFECGIHTCSHCQRGVIVNPLRTRERAYCPKCDHYICDECELVRVAAGRCRTMNQIIEEHQNQAVLLQQRSRSSG